MRFNKTVTFLTIGVGVLVAEIAMATDVNWITPGTNAWETGSNWSSGVVPSSNASNNAFISNGGTAEITQAGQNSQYITLAYGASQTGSVHLISGTLATSVDQNLCRGGVATFTQEAGTTNTSGALVTIGEQSGSRGTYRLNGGVLTVPGNDITVGYNSGSTGTIEQAGGTLGVIGPSKYLILGRLAGAVGNYVMSGGSILFTNNNFASIGNSGTGHFTQNSGTVVVDQQFNIGRQAGGYGDYTLNAGSFLAHLPVLGESSGATGVVTVTGGSFQGGINLSIGHSGCGYLYQSGGVVGVSTQYLYLGELSSSMGTYVLSGTGQLLLTNAANYLYVGNAGNGIFIQSNGTVAVANYLIVGKTNSIGFYRIVNGSLTVGQNLVLGEHASATGTLQVVGSAATINVKTYQQNTNSVLDIVLDNSGVSPINVSSNASVNGELKVGGNAQFYYSSTVTVINASVLSGTFSKKTFLPPLISAEVVYDVANGDVKVTHFKYPDRGMLISIN